MTGDEGRPLRVGIYADDLTGALDAAAPFARAGVTPYVSLFGSLPDGVDGYRVLSLNIDSRRRNRFPAFDRASRAARELRAAGFDMLINKLDSTLRGHAGLEARAALTADRADPSAGAASTRDSGPGLSAGDWPGPRLAIVAPSFPAAGRVVRDGRALVDGVPLAETEVGRDPLSPVSSSELVEIIDANVRMPATHISLAEVRNPARLREIVGLLSAHPPAMAVADAETDADLDGLAALAMASGGDVLLVGSAGVSGAVARALGEASGTPGLLQPVTGGVLFVSGSQRSVAARQLERLAAARQVAWVELDVDRLLDDDTAAAERAVGFDAATTALVAGRHVAISLAAPRWARSVENEAGAGKARDRLVRELGAAAYRLARRSDVGALMLVGGDTALGVLGAVGAAGIVLTDEPYFGVAAGTIQAGLLAGAPVVTKAGAFGGEDVLVKVLDYLTPDLPTMAANRRQD